MDEICSHETLHPASRSSVARSSVGRATAEAADRLDRGSMSTVRVTKVPVEAIPIAEFGTEADAEAFAEKLREAGIPEHSFSVSRDPDTATVTLLSLAATTAGTLLATAATLSGAVPSSSLGRSMHPS